MDYFTYKRGELYCDDIPVKRIAEDIGTPFYLYSGKTLERHIGAFQEALDNTRDIVCFAVKANSNLAVLKFLGERGAGADIVSGGELFRALKAGIPANRIVYSGVGKTAREIEEALKAGILLFNVESLEELETLGSVARSLGVKAPVSFRVNPDVDPRTHPYISTGLNENKFGLSVEDARKAYALASKRKEFWVRGISCHIGSQLTEISPFVDAMKRVLSLVKDLKKERLELELLDIGGGLGIRYNLEEPPNPNYYVRALKEVMGGCALGLILEPGRSIAGNAGILVSRVLYRKKTQLKRFLVVDAAMNDLVRPSLYHAYHEIVPVVEIQGEKEIVDVVGPICETGDFLARDRALPELASGDLIAVRSAGAYGFSMSSNYNSRPRVPEVMVYGERFKVVRRRETYEDLVRGEEFFE